MEAKQITYSSQKAISTLSSKMAFDLNVLPLNRDGKTLVVGASIGNNKRLINDLSFYTGLNIKVKNLPADYIVQELKKLYKEPVQGDTVKNISGNVSAEYSNVEFVDNLISEAVKSGASDIHLELYENIFRVRYRIDGQLREVMNISKTRSAVVVSRVKILAGLDISEKRRPQDGRIKFKFGKSSIDIRVSTLPTGYGEKVVLRILDKSNVNLDVKEIGFNSKQLKILISKVKLPYGMVLVTGPTGSGKTTTLYAALKKIHSIEKNIITIEDPIEYNLQGINQCNVKHDIGFDFANALRAFLRQDPDVIMVGEIRDKETADIAIRAALTGHLVFSTLHTNDSVSAISRLIDMGIEPFLVAASLRLVIAQRLVRKLCSCQQQRDHDLKRERHKIVDCQECGATGFKGRTAIFEFLEINDELEEMISKNISFVDIKNYLIQNGFKSLHQAGIEKINQGITTNEEVFRETQV